MPKRKNIDINLLTKYFCKENKTLHEIGRLLSCDRKVIADRIKEYQLTRYYKDPEWLRQKHHVEKLTIEKMSNLASCSRESIRINMRKNNIETLDEVRYSGATKYNRNENYFDNIDNEEKAYWLGFIMADGGINYESCDTYRLVIQLSSVDRTHLQKFLVAIESDAPIEDGTTSLKITGKTYSYSKIRINSSYMCKSLMSYGVVPNKSGKEKLPEIPGNLIKHFIRGVFDGDGSFTYWYSTRQKKMLCGFNIVGSFELVTEIADILYLEFGLDVSTRPDGDVICRIDVNNSTTENIMQWLYSDANVYLERKYQKFQEWLSLNS